MYSSIIKCSVCGETSVTNLGQLNIHSGVINFSNPSSLCQCSTCGLLFRYPYLSPEYLKKAYSELPANLWTYSNNRYDTELAKKTILKLFSSGCILDVGCFRGDFLNMLPDRYKKYGIEPSKMACIIAQGKNINLIGSSIDDIEIDRPMFHAITLLDVIEHIPYPLISLQKLIKLLLPGGIIIISTGNTGALPWRLMRRDYWYYFSEHVNFFNLRCFRWLIKQLKLDLLTVRKFSHFSGTFLEKWHQLARCIVFWIVNSLHKYPSLEQAICTVYPFNRVKKWFSPPKADLWKDHILIVLKIPN